MKLFYLYLFLSGLFKLSIVNGQAEKYSRRLIWCFITMHYVCIFSFVMFSQIWSQIVLFLQILCVLFALKSFLYQLENLYFL